ncbi:MAG TPA: hypothetical protein VE967_06945 [Gemmatimonadaceae bacterium]|nr:hypothetical protein [Gemmatimonadaceae bacterium]
MRAAFAGTMMIAVAVAVACGGTPTADVPVDVFQITDISVGPKEVHCAGGGYGYELRFNVRLVNTTDEDVTITDVRSNGVVIRSSSSVDVGNYMHVQDSVPFVPLTVQAHDKSGTATLQVTVDGSCGSITPSTCKCSGVVTGGQPPPCSNGLPCSFAGTSGYRDVQTTLWVRTPHGEYATVPIVTRFYYA